MMEARKISATQRQPYGNGHFEVSDKGVYFHGLSNDGSEMKPQWICSRLRVIAQTRDDKNSEWGRLLEWRDNDDQTHQWAMPMELLEGDGIEVRRFLASKGVSIAIHQKVPNNLLAYLKAWSVSERARCVDRLGWHSGIFVMPERSIGESNERVVFQNQHAVEPAMASAGTVEEWRERLARLAQGNSRLVFAISLAFAGPLLDIVDQDSGGFHLRGGSSSGKSTALKVAASVWGRPSRYICNWRATANGLEGLAAMHNDLALILDELGQADPKEVGDAAYMLANGQGKARAARYGQAKLAQRWREVFLSAGEESLAGMMEKAGKKASAGQEIRLAEIDTDAGAGMGLFEDIHEYTSSAAFAGALVEATEAAYGSVGQAWLECLVADRPLLGPELVSQIKQFVARVVPRDAHGQVGRVANRFAVMAVAGELATRYGLTGWPANEALKAAEVCFRVWLDGFGGAENREQRAIVSLVRNMLEMHGASRFEALKATSEQRVPNRLGYYRTNSDGAREYLVPRESFDRDFCNGFQRKVVIAALQEAGMLLPAGKGRPAQNIRTWDHGSCRVYVLRYTCEQGANEGDSDMGDH